MSEYDICGITCSHEFPPYFQILLLISNHAELAALSSTVCDGCAVNEGHRFHIITLVVSGIAGVGRAQATES